MAWFDEFIRQGQIEQAKREKEQRALQKRTDAPVLEVLEDEEHENVIERVEYRENGKIKSIEIIDQRPAKTMQEQINRAYLRVQARSDQEWLVNQVWGVEGVELPKPPYIDSEQLVELIKQVFDHVETSV